MLLLSNLQRWWQTEGWGHVWASPSGCQACNQPSSLPSFSYSRWFTFQNWPNRSFFQLRCCQSDRALISSTKGTGPITTVNIKSRHSGFTDQLLSSIIWTWLACEDNHPTSAAGRRLSIGGDCAALLLQPTRFYVSACNVLCLCCNVLCLCI